MLQSDPPKYREAINNPAASGEYDLNFNGEVVEIASLPMPANSPLSAQSVGCHSDVSLYEILSPVRPGMLFLTVVFIIAATHYPSKDALYHTR